MGKIIESYALQDIIGEGMYGKVYRAVHLRTKDQFAVKVIPVQKFQENPKLQECTVNEINILSKIEPSPYIIRYVEMLKTPNNFYFIYEYCNGKTLEVLLRQEGKLEESKALKIFKQLLEAFKILNKYNIMHRDLKPDNIFFHNGNLKLGDFGFCKTLGRQDDMASTMLGSPIFMAPEVLRGEIYTSKADIWSLGVVLFQMLFGYCPFQSNSIAKLIAVLEETDLKLPLQINNISTPTQNLLKKLLVKDQFKRIDWFELLQYDISQSGYIVEKRSADAKLDELREILSQKQLTTATYGHSQSDDYNYKKMSDVSSNSSGSKVPTVSTNPFSRTAKVTSFQEKPTFEQKNINFRRKATKEQPRKNIDNSNEFFTNTSTKAYSNPTITKKHSLPSTYGISKRRSLLQEHSHCMSGIRLAMNLLREDEPLGISLSHLVFQKIEQRLKRISSSITSSDIDIDDISSTINQQLKQVEKQLQDLKDEMSVAGVESCQLADHKGYLRGKFRQKERNGKLWYEMIHFLKGEQMAINELSGTELNHLITKALA